jgi:hypothetical protein
MTIEEWLKEETMRLGRFKIYCVNAQKENLELIQSLGREGLGGSRPQRVLVVEVIMNRRVQVHDQDRLASVPRFGEGIKIAEV